MRRRSLLLAMLAAAGCGTVQLAPMPESVGDWRRGPVESIPADRLPPAMRQLGATGGARASYTRSGSSIGIDAYFFPSDASAFEARQKHNIPGSVAFHHGSVFVVCTSAETGRTVVEFSGDLERTWLTNAK